MMKKAFSVLFAFCLCSAFGAATDPDTVSRIEAAVAGDGQCHVPFMTEFVHGGRNLTEVYFVIRPSPHSYIRCRLALPRKKDWTGRLWGHGCGGWAGTVPYILNSATNGDAAVTCDMGTGISCGWTNRSTPMPWHDEVWKDFNWRSTHLMTVYAKKFCKALYGSEPHHSYFIGASTGGGQGMHEAQRFPEDYDGIVSELPAHNRTAIEASAFHRLKLASRLMLNDERIKILADAPIEFMADKDAAFARGKYLSDPRACDGNEDAILDIAARKDPVFSRPDVREAIKELFAGPVHRQRRVHGGYCWGAKFSYGAGLFLFRNHYEGKYKRRFDPKNATWDDFDDFIEARKSDLNATSPDLSAFAARGGKIMMTVGLEDQTIPFSAIVDIYEETAEKMGGIDRLRGFYRMYLMPGCAHGNIGREFRSCPIPELKRNIVDWVDKGIAPKFVCPKTHKGEMLRIPAYPDAVVENGKTGVVPRGGVRKIHPFYR